MNSVLYPPIPSEYVIDTGNLCNLKCPFCPTGVRRTNMSKGMMTLETFKCILGKVAPYAYYFEMMNWGEPFLNKDFVTIISLAAGEGIRTNVDSNLTVKGFSDNDAESVVRSGLWRLRASIDGASQETYAQYRCGGNFRMAINNLACIQRAKDKLRSLNPVIEWQFLVNGKNEHELEKAKKMAADIGVGICFRPMSTWGHSEWLSQLHNLAEVGKFREEEWTFPAPERLQEKVKFFEPKHWSPQAQKHKVNLPEGVPEGCSQPFDRVTINWDGRILPCCMCYGDNFYVGNLLTQSIEEIWLGDMLRSSRQFLLNYGPKQNTESVCETGACAMAAKYIGEPDTERARRDDKTFSAKPTKSPTAAAGVNLSHGSEAIIAETPEE